MKRFAKLLLLFTLSLLLVSCNPTNNGFGQVFNPVIETAEYSVNFVIDGDVKHHKIVTNREVFNPPEIPLKRNFKIVGWVNEDGNLHNFKKPINKSMHLYAKYEADHAQIINELSKNIVSANVKIKKTAYNRSFLGLIKTDIIAGTGSGIIFHDQHDNYYVLTNEHVTTKMDRSYVDYIITDYKGNTYKVKITEDFEQASYDLSVLYFGKSKEKLHVIKRASLNPIITSEIISLGQPKGQNNTITFGIVNKYEKVKLTNNFEPLFNVIQHSSPIYGGSSGGALLDFDFNLVGLNFASASNPNGNFIYAFAIPIEEIDEYLRKFVFIK